MNRLCCEEVSNFDGSGMHLMIVDFTAGISEFNNCIPCTTELIVTRIEIMQLMLQLNSFIKVLGNNSKTELAQN